MNTQSSSLAGTNWLTIVVLTPTASAKNFRQPDEIFTNHFSNWTHPRSANHFSTCDHRHIYLASIFHTLALLSLRRFLKLHHVLHKLIYKAIVIEIFSRWFIFWQSAEYLAHQPKKQFLISALETNFAWLECLRWNRSFCYPSAFFSLVNSV